MTNDAKTIRKNIRDALTDVFVSLARVLFFWVPGGDEAIGKALMTAHPFFLVITIAMFFVMPARSIHRIGIAAFAVLVSMSQWMFSGCIITRAEQKLTGGKDTIFDPFLTLAGLEVSRDSRVAATIAAGTTTCAMLLWALFCDFALFA